MKRHESLAPLSRDHHHTLILAQLLQKNAPTYRGMPASAEGKLLYAVNFFDTKLLQHFALEEQVFTVANNTNQAISDCILELKAEHQSLISMFNACRTGKTTSDEMHILGVL